MSLSLPVLLVASAFAVGLILLCVGILMAWRDTVQRIGGGPVDLHGALLPEIGNIIERIETRLSAQEIQRAAEMEHLRQSLSHMRSDVEWLTSERMIEQAIEMCRDGLSNDRISQELGMQPESVRTLKLLRAH